MTNKKEKIIKLPSFELASDFQSQDIDALMDALAWFAGDNKSKAHKPTSVIKIQSILSALMCTWVEFSRG